MSYQSVDVHVKDSTPNGDPVEGVLVRVFDATNRVFQTQETTNAAGVAGFTLFTADYNLRFYKFGVQVRQPQRIKIVVPPAGQPLINGFTIVAVVFQHPISNDPRLCRASGYFRDITGAPNPKLHIHIVGQFDSILLEDAGVLRERRALRTDMEGFACVDLIRCARYIATVQGYEDTQRTLEVPDLPSVNLPDLLFPVVKEISLTPPGPYTMATGSRRIVVPVVTASNGVQLQGTATADVQWLSSNEAVLGVGVASSELTLIAKKPGTATLQAVRADNSVIHIPQVAILGVPQNITVT